MRTDSRHRAWLSTALFLIVTLLTGGHALGATPQLAAGSSHTISLHSDGTLWGAGQNAFGQLGDGTVTDRTNPVRIGGAVNWTAIAAGSEHNLALRSDGTLWAWGLGDFGQLGVVTGSGRPPGNQLVPVQIGSGQNWIAVAAGGASSFALKADGTLWAWGDNTNGQLGNGAATGLQVNTPAQVLNPSGIPYTAIACGAGHALALQADGSLWSWGGNANGELGLGDTLPQATPATPVQVIVAALPSDNDWKGIAAGDSHSLALKADGTLWSWGSNARGQLGQPAQGTTLPLATPTQVGTDQDWARIAAGSLTSYALKRTGILVSFGDNGRGQLGAGQNALFSITPVAAAPSNGDFVTLAAGSLHAVGLKAGGALYAFGDNSFGQFGTGTKTGSPAPVAAGRDSLGWVASEPGNQFTVARRSNGTLWSWGDNFNGQLGDGTTTSHRTPAQVGSAATWVAHASGLIHTAALRSDGTLWVWGDNSSGQLGTGSSNPSLVPVQITGTSPASTPNNWAAVASGDFHTLALQGDGTLWAWGDNSFGQLGLNSTLPAFQPQQVIAPGSTPSFNSGWVAIAAGGSHSVGLQADGTVWVWGDNSLGQLGLGAPDAGSPVPVQMTANRPNFNSSWKAISAGLGHTLALQADGTLWGFGDNTDGELGNGSAVTPQPAPVQVLGSAAAGYVAAAAGDSHSAARRADGTLWSWGNDLSGQLGNGANPAPVATPVQESGLSTLWAGLSVAGSHSVAQDAAGFLWAWGSNFSGQLGDGTTLNKNTPEQLLEAFASVAPSLNFGSLALGSAPVTLPLAIGNPGNAPLSVSAAPLSGADSGLFSVALGSCALVPAGGSCQLQVTLSAPANAGARSATLTVASNDPVQPQAQVALSASFAQLLSITTSVTPAGAGTITGPAQVLPGSSPTYTIAAALGFHLTDVKVGGVSQGVASSLTLASLSAGTSIDASFALNPHTVTLTAGANGVISGPTAVLQNDTPSYAISPDPGFRVLDVTVNGVSQGAVTSLTLPPITADVTIAASFAVNSFAITTSAGVHGTITGPATALVGSTPSYLITPDPGCFITSVTINGAAQPFTASGMTVTLPAIAGPVTLAVTFDITTFTVTVTADAKGSISPAGTQAIPFGSNQTYSFTPNAGYHVVNVVADGVAQGSVASFTFTNVTANGHTLSVQFIPNGDLNGDGKVDIADALAALRISVLLDVATPQQLLRADVAPLDTAGVPVPDNQITIGDALGILRKAVGLPTGF